MKQTNVIIPFQDLFLLFFQVLNSFKFLKNLIFLFVHWVL